MGRPLLDRNLVEVNATIIEKTISHTRTHFRKKRRKQYTNIKFQRSASTMLRINCVNIVGRLGDVGLDAERTAPAITSGNEKNPPGSARPDFGKKQ